MPPIAVLDANVLISGIGWRGVCSRIIDRVREGQVLALTCSQIIDDVVDKLQNKVGLSAQETDQAIAELYGLLRWIQITGTLHVVASDPDDDPIVECAVLGGADYIVTGDRRHLLPLKTYNGIRVVSPAEFLALLPAE